MSQTGQPKVYTTSKIYFIVKDIDDFKNKYDKYFKDLEEVYQTGSHSYDGKDFYNIQMDYRKGMFSQEYLNQLMNTFVMEINTKSDIKSAYYKYKNNNTECKLYWKNPLLS